MDWTVEFWIPLWVGTGAQNCRSFSPIVPSLGFVLASNSPSGLGT